MEEKLREHNGALTATAKSLQELTLSVLSVTHDLAQKRPVGNSTFLRVLEATYRRAFSTLDAIYHLVDAPDFSLGNQAMILMRSLLEDGISIEYMKANDEEAMAEQFTEFAYMQGHEDNKFLQEAGQDSESIVIASVKEIEENYNRVKVKYRRPDGSKFRTWAGKDIDGMLADLRQQAPEEFKIADSKSSEHAYLRGNRKTHFNPVDLAIYLDQRQLSLSYADSAVTALAVGLSVYIRLTTRYIDSIRAATGENLYQDIADHVIAVFKEMDDIELPSLMKNVSTKA